MSGYYVNFKDKGRKAEIFVEGKTLKQIADEAGLEEYIVRNRYRRNGIRDIAGLTKPKSKSRSVFRRVYNICSSGKRMMEVIYEKDIPIHKLSEATGIEESTIYKFLQDGRDISSMRLAKLCSYLGVSMDYIMGLSEEKKIMCKWNDCEKCPYYDAYIPYWSDDGCPVETCGAGLDPEDGCRHNRLVRWILFKIQQRKERKQEAYMMSLLEPEEEKKL